MQNQPTIATHHFDSAAVFFMENAGFSYDPKKETKEEGQLRGALALARAERDAKSAGFRFEWTEDNETTRSFRDEGPHYVLHVCCCYTGSGELISALGGIDQGEDGNTHDVNARCVEAEVALEALGIIDRRDVLPMP